MPLRLLVVAFASLTLLAPVYAQSKSGPAARGAAAALPQYPGYETRQIEGFTFLLKPEVVLHLNDAEYQRKPLEVLELEVQTLIKILRPEAVAVLRQLLILVEWDRANDLAYGRGGGSVAYYDPNPPELRKATGGNPLEAKNITINTMKNLTRGRQPDRPSWCLLLHEMSHAVHDRYCGREHDGIKTAYRLARERKLYDNDAYVATNEFEYFACLSESYFDQGTEFPKTHDELKQHDPTGFQVLYSVWGPRKPEPKSATPTTTPAAAASNVKLEEIDFGDPVSGPPATAESLRGNPVFVVAWNESKPAWILKANSWHAELSGFGLQTVAIHCTGNGQMPEVKKTIDERGVKFAVSERPWVANDLVENFADFPKGFVFDRSGKCVFEGSPFHAEPAIRAAVTETLLAELGDPLPKNLTAAATQLRAGKSPPTVLALVTSAARVPDAQGKEAAQKLLTRLTAGAEAKLAEAEKIADSDPVEAFVLVNKLPQDYRGTTVALRATQLLAKLRRHKAVLVEFEAQPALAQIYKIDLELSVRPGSFNPTDPQFQEENRGRLQLLQQGVTFMRSKWPDARSTTEAVRIGRTYGVVN